MLQCDASALISSSDIASPLSSCVQLTRVNSRSSRYYVCCSGRFETWSAMADAGNFFLPEDAAFLLAAR